MKWGCHGNALEIQTISTCCNGLKTVISLPQTYLGRSNGNWKWARQTLARPPIMHQLDMTDFTVACHEDAAGITKKST